MNSKEISSAVSGEFEVLRLSIIVEAAERGNIIHNMLEVAFTTGEAPHNQDHKEMFEAVRAILQINCGDQDWEPERSFYSIDYGGKIDLSSKQY